MILISIKVLILMFYSKTHNTRTSANTTKVLSTDLNRLSYIEVYYMGISQWRIYTVKFWTRLLPFDPNLFIFMQFLGIFCQIMGWRSFWGWRLLSGKSWIRPCFLLACNGLSACDKFYCNCNVIVRARRRLILTRTVSRPRLLKQR